MLTAMTRILLLVLALGACGHSAEPKTAGTAPKSCDNVADHVVSLMSASAKNPEDVDPFRRIIAKRCGEDGWSEDAQHCMLAIKALDEGNACEKQLTEAQAKTFEADTQAAAAKLGGGAAPPPPPPASAAVAPGAPPPAQPATTKRKANSSDPDEGGD